MNVLFIYSNKCIHPKCFSFGPAYLAGMLKNTIHNYSLIDTTFGLSDKNIIKKVQSFNPGLIAFSSVTTNFAYTLHLSKIIKSILPEVPILVGGVHPTIDPDNTIDADSIDMICRGEGEEAFLELVNSLARGDDNTSIKNIWFKKDGKIIKNKLRDLVNDLDSLPFADLEIYDLKRYLKNYKNIMTMLGSRGCPYLCSYCINKTLQEEYKGLGPFVRYRNIDSIIKEIKILINKFKEIEGIEFYDDTFTLKKKRVEEFCEKFKQEIGLPFYINARIDNITEEMCRQLKEGGCKRISIGLESGDPVIREQVLKRKMDNEDIVEKCLMVKRYGIEIYTYNMIGIPGETLENIHQTIDLNKKIQPDHLSVSIFNAFNGTELYNNCREKGLLLEEKPNNSFYASSNIIQKEVSLKALIRIRKSFGYYVFLHVNRKKALIDLIDRNMLGFPYYSRIRAIAISLFLNKK